jgi:hypothetical protein
MELKIDGGSTACARNVVGILSAVVGLSVRLCGYDYAKSLHSIIFISAILQLLEQA